MILIESVILSNLCVVFITSHNYMDLASHFIEIKIQKSHLYLSYQKKIKILLTDKHLDNSLSDRLEH